MPTPKVRKTSRARSSKSKRKSSTGFVTVPKKLAKLPLLLFMVVFAVVGGYILLHSQAATAIVAGVYTGPADVAGHENFANSIDSTVPYAVQFMDYRNGWATDFKPDWLLDPMAQWVKEAPGRRLVLSVPMLEQNDGGLAALQRGANGEFDTYFRSLGQDMVTKGLGNSILRIGWESNGDWYAWSAGSDSATHDAWKAYYRRLVGVMRSIPGQSFQFDWNRSAGGSGTNVSFADHYPGDDVVDIISLDRYDIKWQDSTSTPEQRWNWMLTEPMGITDHKNFANAHGKPMAFPEWGLYKPGDAQGGGGDNPYYIDKMADWFTANNVAYQAYFNADWGGGTLANFPNGYAEYKARFGGTNTGPTITTVNDSTVGVATNQFEYGGTWTPEAGFSTYYQTDDRYSGATNSTYKIRFNGHQVSLYGTKAPNHGIGAVSIDGGSETNVDFYAATRANQVVVYNSPVLSEAAHTVTFRVTGTKNASSTGPYTTIDKAQISSGNTTTADTTAPSQPGNLTSPSQTSSSINLTWNASTDNVGITGYDLYRGTGTASPTKLTTLTIPSFTNTGLSANTAYSYYVIARDAAGNSSPASSTLRVSTKAAADTISPTAKITSPSNGASIGSSTTIKATASDNVKVTRLELYIDGSLKTSNTNSTSLSYSWNSRNVLRGAHTIVVKAYDAANNPPGQASITVYR